MTDTDSTDALAENGMLRERVAALDADIIGLTTLLHTVQAKLREAEEELQPKRAAAQQAEVVRTQYEGVLTTVVANAAATGVPTATQGPA